jgi:hypothetical protein
LGYAAVEIVYRVYQYSTIADVLTEGVKAQLPAKGEPRSIFDSHIGDTYVPHLVVKRDDLAFPVAWRTNSYGLVARSEFPIEKPAGVFLSGPDGEALGQIISVDS